ncbi:MAG TPA: hypothetical protein P5229_02245, partial [Candidatus Gracilibacteria bacterium]|nr:hypothetical protein [Candidatus Gracilibacteria bacterium]
TNNFLLFFHFSKLRFKAAFAQKQAQTYPTEIKFRLTANKKSPVIGFAHTCKMAAHTIATPQPPAANPQTFA